MDGFFGKFLDVDLSKETITDYKIPNNWIEKYLGGRGIGARILLEETKGREDPLGPENILIFGTGPLQGTRTAGAGRHVVMSISPKTKSISDSYAGGFFAQELGTSGYDGIIVRGQAKSPKYLALIDGEANIQNANDLWSEPVGVVDNRLKEEYEGGKVSAIGIAGENLVKFSCIINDRNRAAGRPGFGAVMGSKKLKAIIVKGSSEKPLFDEKALKKARSNLVSKLIKSPVKSWGKYGTTGTLLGLNELGILPTKNFQKGFFDNAEDISGEAMFEKIQVNRDSCTGCPVRCKHIVKTEFEGEKVKEEYGGPEYETLAAFGSLCLNNNLKSIALANQKCNMYGLDTISTGNTIAFTMEATEKGLIDDGIDWGNSGKILEIIEKIAKKEGIGKRLAKGIDELAEELEADFAMQVKGQEIPMHEPRGKKALAISYSVSPRGANHMEILHDTINNHPSELPIKGSINRLDIEKKPFYCKIYEDLVSFTNSSIQCAFTSWIAHRNAAYTYPEIRKAIEAATGMEINSEKMLIIGERNFNLLKILAMRSKISRKEDKLPNRFEEPLQEGASSGESIPNKKLKEKIEEYYKIRGWDNFGPTEEKLEELGIGNLGSHLKRPA